MAGPTADPTRRMAGRAVEVIAWDPANRADPPGFAHGLTRYGPLWMEVGIAVVPVDADPFELSTKSSRYCAKLSLEMGPTLSISPLRCGRHRTLRHDGLARADSLSCRWTATAEDFPSAALERGAPR